MMKFVLICIIAISQIISVCTIEDEQASFPYYDDGLSNRDASVSSVGVYSSSLERQSAFLTDPAVLGLFVVVLGGVTVFALLGFIVSSLRGGNSFGIAIGKTIPEKAMELVENFGAVINDKERLDNLSGKVNEAIEFFTSLNDINILPQSNIHKIKWA